MPRDQVSVAYPLGGLNFKEDPLVLNERQYRFAVNTQINSRSIASRDGLSEVRLVSDTDGLVDDFQQLNFQSAIRYSPSQGQSAIQQADKGEFMLVAAGGRKFTIQLQGRGRSSVGILKEIPSEINQPSDLHQVWLTQAENYAISGDDFASTWIYDSQNTAFPSEGYDLIDRESSRVPNRMRNPAYYDGRLVVTVNDSNLFIGDLIHSDGLTTSERLLGFTEQTYWATGQNVSLPTEAGHVTAAYPLPSLTDLDNQSGLVIEAQNSVYFLRLDVPRERWGDTQILFLSSGEAGATGQFSFDKFNDDSVRRTLNGIERLSFDRRSSEIDGSSRRISDPIDDFLDLDYPPELRFASLKLDRNNRRMFCTVRPWMSGAHWQHRGMICYNTEDNIWESLWTFPEWCKDIKHILPMQMGGERRMFTFCGGGGKCIRLIELDSRSREDTDCDGNVTQIEKQLYPRSIFEDLRKSVTIESGYLEFENLIGDVEWEVNWKSDFFCGKWRPWASGCISAPEKINSIEQCSKVVKVNLPEFIGAESEGVTIEHALQFDFQIIWRGKADLRFHSFESREFEGEIETTMSPEQFNVETEANSFNDDYFSYNRIS